MNVDSTQLRLRLIGVVIVSLMAVLVARLWFLQSVSHAELGSVAKGNLLKEVLTPGPRGRILDAKNRELARNHPVTVVSIDLAELDRVFPASQHDKRNDMLLRLATELSKSGRLTKLSELQNALKASGLTNLGKVVVATGVSPELFAYFGELQDEYPGVQIATESVREYPYGTLAAHVLGYMGRIDQQELQTRNAKWSVDDPNAKTYLPDDQIGLTGVERMFEDDLRGYPGRDVYEVDRNGRVIRQVASTPPRAGNDVVLNIDIDVQKTVEEELARGLQTARDTPPPPKTDPNAPDPPPAKAAAGTAVVMDPVSGAIIAMASYPTYDPNDFVGGISQAKFAALNDKAAFQPIVNRAIQGQYAPGSTFKLFTAYAAMTKGPNAHEILSAPPDGIGGWLVPKDDPGYYQIPDDLCNDKRDEEIKANKGDKSSVTSCRFVNPDLARHSNLDITRALSVSSDAYFYEIAANFDLRKDFKSDTIQRAAVQFGFGRTTGSGLPGEVAGVVPTEAWLKDAYKKAPAAFGRDYWVTADTVQMAVGQGLNLVTPLQLTNAYATFANGGTLNAPNIAKEVRSPQKQVLRTFERRVVGNVDIPAEVYGPIRDGLLGAVGLDGPEGDKGTAFDAFHYPSRGGIDFDLEQFPIAGKTGTAEVQGKADSAWFIGYGPVKDNQPPKYIMSVMLEESGFGGKFAAPVVAFTLNDLLFNAVAPAMSSDDINRCAAPAPQVSEPSRFDFSAYKPPPTTTTSTTSSTSTTTTRTTTSTTTTRPTTLPPASRAGPPQTLTPTDPPPAPECHP